MSDPVTYHLTLLQQLSFPRHGIIIEEQRAAGAGRASCQVGTALTDTRSEYGVGDLPIDPDPFEASS